MCCKFSRRHGRRGPVVVLIRVAASSVALPAAVALADPPLPTFGPTVYNVAVANASINGGTPASTGSSDNAAAINAYITYCSGHGGGTVEVPAGTWLSG